MSSIQVTTFINTYLKRSIFFEILHVPKNNSQALFSNFEADSETNENESCTYIYLLLEFFFSASCKDAFALNCHSRQKQHSLA